MTANPGAGAGGADGRRRRPRPPRSRAEHRDVREAILTATEALLAQRRFADLAVAHVLEEAGVSRASFYFYFQSKYEVLGELARRAVGSGHAAGQPWLSRGNNEDPTDSLREGIAGGARVWARHAPVLRAVVENWREDPELAALWTELMASYTDAAARRIEQDRLAAGTASSALDVRPLAATLTWLGERLYYLAAIGVAPFDDEDTLVQALLEVWTATLYRNTLPR
jgi:TetR/AcrR family transcriptional regulator, ethionamide resistance regulator